MTVHGLNTLPEPEFKLQLLNYCGSAAWVNKMHALVPYEDLVELLTSAEEQWYQCSQSDWIQALSKQDTWVDVEALMNAETNPQVAPGALAKTTNAFVEKTDEYKKKFGFNFIVFDINKTADELLDILQSRMQNSSDEELKIAAAEQNKITQLRIQKLLA